MAKLEEIIKTEMSRSDSRTFSKIHLFREGSFLRAYEQSAWLMSRYAFARRGAKVDEALKIVIDQAIHEGVIQNRDGKLHRL